MTDHPSNVVAQLFHLNHSETLRTSLQGTPTILALAT